MENKSKSIVYPISANPPTWGHADIMYRAAKKFDYLYWTASKNPHKGLSFKDEKRIEMMELYVAHYGLTNVKVETFEGSTVRFAESKDAGFILRGLRNTSDFHGELELATGNRGINKEIETICLYSRPHFATISSSLVRELAMLGEEIDQYLLPSVAKIVREELN